VHGYESHLREFSKGLISGFNYFIESGTRTIAQLLFGEAPNRALKFDVIVGYAKTHYLFLSLDLVKAAVPHMSAVATTTLK